MRQLKDLTVKGMALVKSPANRKAFLLRKSEDAQVAQSEEPVIKAAPDDIISAVRAIKLEKGENAQATDALEAVAHLLHSSPELSLADVLAAGQAAGLDDVEKAAPKKRDEEDDDEDEDDDEIDEDVGEDDDDENEEDEDDKPAWLKRKLKKAGWDESAHPRADNGRFGEGGGTENSSAPGSAYKKADSASNKAFRTDKVDDHKAAVAAHEKVLTSAKASADDKSSSKASITQHKNDIRRLTTGDDPFLKSADMAPVFEKSQFADSSANQGEAEMADIEKAQQRQFVSKSEYDQVLDQVAKAHERIEKMEQEDALRAEKSANQGIYGDLKVDHDSLARTTLALRKSAPKDLEALETTLKAANEQVRVAKASGGSLFRASSSQPYVGTPVAKRQGDQFKQLVDDYLQKNAGSTRQAAIAAVAKSAEAVNAYNQLGQEAN